MAFLLNSQAQGVSGKMNNLPKHHGPGLPEARGPMQLHRLETGSAYACHFSATFIDAPLFPYIFYLYSCSAPVHEHPLGLLFCLLIPCVLLLLFNYMWNVIDSDLIRAYNRAGWAVDPYDLSQTVRDSNMLEHINLPNMKFSIFLYSHQYAINSCSLMLFFSHLLRLCFSWFESQFKNH